MEEKEKYLDIRSIILKVLFLMLFIFLLLWLAPYPKDKVVYDHLFNENLENIKDAAKSYYTIDRMPKDIGDKDSMTVREMLDQKMILPFLDDNGKECDLNESYVEITRMENEYILKVYLQCQNKSDYILEHIGCYNICDDCGNVKDFEEECDKEEPEEEKQTKDITEYYLKKTSTNSYWTSYGKLTTKYLEKTSTRRRKEYVQVIAKKKVTEEVPIYKYEKDLTKTVLTYRTYKTITNTIRTPHQSCSNRTVRYPTGTSTKWDSDCGCYKTVTTYGYKTVTSCSTSYTYSYTYTYVACNNGNYVQEKNVQDGCAIDPNVAAKPKEIVTGKDTKWLTTAPEDYIGDYTFTGDTDTSGEDTYEYYNDGKWTFKSKLPDEYDIIVSTRKVYSYSYYKTKKKTSYKWYKSKILSGWDYTGKTRTKTITL